jgi:hypothetical protein
MEGNHRGITIWYGPETFLEVLRKTTKTPILPSRSRVSYQLSTEYVAVPQCLLYECRTYAVLFGNIFSIILFS